MQDGQTSIGSKIGALCSLFLFVILLAYGAQKLAILVQKGDTNLTVTRLANYFDDTEKMTADDGMFFAFSVRNFAKEIEGKFVENGDYRV